MEALQVIALFFGIAADMAIFFLVFLIYREAYGSAPEHKEIIEDEEDRQMRAKAAAFDEIMNAMKKGDDPFALEDEDVED